jgi:hypothetical protein
MFFIPGALISFLTFPGVIVHEWAHELFCKLFGVRVHKVIYYQLSNPPGYVLHETPKTYKQTFWISIGPLLINSLSTIALGFVATQTISGGWFWYTLLWLAFSTGMHAFPSDQDMQHVSSASRLALNNGASIIHYLAFPFVALVWLANKLRVIWFDAIYAILLISISGGFGAIDNMGGNININSNIDNQNTQVNETGTQDTQATTRGDGVIIGSYLCPLPMAAIAETMRPNKSVSDHLKSEKNNIDNQEREVKSFSDTINTYPLDRSDQNDIDNYNQIVDNYNSRLTSYKSNLATYNSEIDQYNITIDKYNGFLEKSCAHI